MEDPLYLKYARDTITSLQVTSPDHPSKKLGVAASWDAQFYVFSLPDGGLRATGQDRHPLLDAAFVGDSSVVAGGLNQTLKHWDLPTGQSKELGQHKAPIQAVAVRDHQIITGSWDSSLCLWDLRDPLVQTVGLPGKVYALAQRQHTVAVGLEGNLVHLLDFRQPKSPLAVRKTPFKGQIRSVDVLTGNPGYLAAGSDGRAAWVNLASKEDSFAFRCHRRVIADKEISFPVNAIRAFGDSACITAGNDGTVVIWDAPSRKTRLKLPRWYENSVTALATAPGWLIVGLGYRGTGQNPCMEATTLCLWPHDETAKNPKKPD